MDFENLDEFTTARLEKMGDEAIFRLARIDPAEFARNCTRHYLSTVQSQADTEAYIHALAYLVRVGYITPNGCEFIGQFFGFIRK